MPPPPRLDNRMIASSPLLSRLTGDVDEQLAWVSDMMRELSRATEPQELVRLYSSRMEQISEADGFLTLSRRELSPPTYRITRSSLWEDEIDPWRDVERLPTMQHGLLGELIYGDEARMINDLADRVADDDPAREYLDGYGSLMAIPLFDTGDGLNMVIQLRRDADSYDPAHLPGQVWMSNLFGRATHNLVLKHELEDAQKALQREIREIARMQRSLVTVDLPTGYGMDLAEYWQPSDQAGGDFFNVWPLRGDDGEEDGKLGLMIADVSGHGVAAAVFTAIAHAIVHTDAGPHTPPDRVLSYLNGHLCRQYTRATSQFITGVFAAYDREARTLHYSSAGHPPPYVVSGCGGDNYPLDGARSLPLGIEPDAPYTTARARLGVGDVIVFYTDGITEARDPHGQLFGDDRLRDVLDACQPEAADIIRRINEAVDAFTHGRPADDDRTILVACVE